VHANETTSSGPSRSSLPELDEEMFDDDASTSNTDLLEVYSIPAPQSSLKRKDLEEPHETNRSIVSKKASKKRKASRKRRASKKRKHVSSTHRHQKCD